MKLTSAEKREVDRIARKIHHCPERYVGPCWGPIPEDIEEATRQVIAARPATSERTGDER